MPTPIAANAAFSPLSRLMLSHSYEDESGQEQSRRLIEEGDVLYGMGEGKAAAEKYRQALSLSPHAITHDKYLLLADRIAEAGRLKEAIWAIQRLAVDSRPARLRLARWYSWQGRYRSAINEILGILDEAPDSPEALQIRADALLWFGNAAEALPIYERILLEQDDFNARVSQVQALLRTGEWARVAESREQIAASTNFQQEKLRLLDREILHATGRLALLAPEFYSDTDKNERWTHEWRLEYPLRNIRFVYEGNWTRATDRIREEILETHSGGILFFPAPWMQFEGLLGTGGIKDASEGNQFIGRGAFNINAGYCQLELAAERKFFSDTALVLANRISIDEIEANAVLYLTDRYSLKIKAKSRQYSDSNHSTEFKPSFHRMMLLSPVRISLGVEHQRIEFDRQSGGGYFDPSILNSDRLLINAFSYKESFQGSVEIYLGEQKIRRFGTIQRDTIIGGTANLRFKLNRNLDLTLEVEGGDFAVQASGGFRYLLLTGGMYYAF